MRYEVYGWTDDDAEAYEEDTGNDLDIDLDRDLYGDPVLYGAFLGESDNEEEALRMTSTDYTISCVWDNEEKMWFNQF